MPYSRNRSTAHKVYLPTSTRENQYLLVDIPLTEQLIAHILSTDLQAKVTDLSEFYYNLNKMFFECCDQFELRNAVFIANDKLPKVHFNSEEYQMETAQQLVFFYDPALHSIRQSYFHGDHKAKKIKLLFLATGEDIRFNSPHFNAQVRQVLNIFANKANIDLSSIRVRDHQHLTFDLFAKEKGCRNTKGHKLRAIPVRYDGQQIELPENITEISYAVATLPMTAALRKLVDFDFATNEPFKVLYEFINSKFKTAAENSQIISGAMIANGLAPIVRQNSEEEITTVGEVQKLSYNSENPQHGFTLSCDAKMLVNKVYIVMAASKENYANQGYAKFLQQVANTLTTLVTELALDGKQDEILIRLHQHISFKL